MNNKSIKSKTNPKNLPSRFLWLTSLLDSRFSKSLGDKRLSVKDAINKENAKN